MFDGQWGYLDHALGSASIVSQVAGVGDYHINADEPSVLDYNTNFKTSNQQSILYAQDEFRISDHDPVMVGLNLVNYPPELGEIAIAPNPVALGLPVSASATFSDPDQLDTHTATWDWGDGTTSAGAVSEAAGSGTITGDHTYAAPGIYTVSLTVTDGYNNDTAVYQYVIVFNPNGGFTTGGGWIDSPAGAYAYDPSAAGKMTFGFTVKYLPGDLVPSGNLTFQIHPVQAKFDAIGFDWLVVSGNTAYVQGVGVLDNLGVYNFLLSVTDDPAKRGVDRFRLKIWEPISGIVIYDNQAGAPIPELPAQPISGGSLKIHK